MFPHRLTLNFCFLLRDDKEFWSAAPECERTNFSSSCSSQLFFSVFSKSLTEHLRSWTLSNVELRQLLQLQAFQAYQTKSSCLSVSWARGACWLKLLVETFINHMWIFSLCHAEFLTWFCSFDSVSWGPDPARQAGRSAKARLSAGLGSGCVWTPLSERNSCWFSLQRAAFKQPPPAPQTHTCSTPIV